MLCGKCGVCLESCKTKAIKGDKHG
jgi:NAD-dependent dihydropyrimidine dehydrogenase PreA subunit